MVGPAANCKHKTCIFAGKQLLPRPRDLWTQAVQLPLPQQPARRALQALLGGPALPLRAAALGTQCAPESLWLTAVSRTWGAALLLGAGPGRGPWSRCGTEAPKALPCCPYKRTFFSVRRESLGGL